MKLSTRVRYGMRAMVELAKQREGQPVPLGELARRQGISAKYLEQMASSLKISGLIESVRGAEGGYRLAREAHTITAWDIYSVLDGTVELVDCQKAGCAGSKISCKRKGACAAEELWLEVYQKVSAVLHSRTLSQLAEREELLRNDKAAEVPA